jgi:mannose-6-phosphate isomerase-like protein (cupin superfamily)
MTTRKHLVLDDDVHEALTLRRDMMGFPIKQIGNGILRSHISASLFTEFLGEKLTEMGCVTKEQFQDVLQHVDRRLKDERRAGAPPLTRLPNGHFVSGSWEIKTLFEDPVGSFQLLEAWARDGFQNSMTQHIHDSEEYLIALSGRCFVVMGGTPFTLTSPSGLRISAGAPHSATPLDRECRIAILVTPSVPEYASQNGA